MYRFVAYHISSEYWALPKIRFDHYLLSFFSSVFWWQVAFPIIKNILCQQHYQITVPALFWTRNCYITLPNRNLGYCKVAWKWWTRFLGIQSACRHKTIIVPMGLCGLWWGNSLWMTIVGHIWVSVHCMNTIVIIVVFGNVPTNTMASIYAALRLWFYGLNVLIWGFMSNWCNILTSLTQTVPLNVRYMSRLHIHLDVHWLNLKLHAHGVAAKMKNKKWYGMHIWHYLIKIEILHVFIWRCIYSEICLLIYY